MHFLWTQRTEANTIAEKRFTMEVTIPWLIWKLRRWRFIVNLTKNKWSPVELVLVKSSLLTILDHLEEIVATVKVRNWCNPRPQTQLNVLWTPAALLLLQKTAGKIVLCLWNQAGFFKINVSNLTSRARSIGWRTLWEEGIIRNNLRLECLTAHCSHIKCEKWLALATPAKSMQELRQILNLKVYEPLCCRWA